jgi:hypothetical protein
MMMMTFIGNSERAAAAVHIFVEARPTTTAQTRTIVGCWLSTVGCVLLAVGRWLLVIGY